MTRSTAYLFLLLVLSVACRTRKHTYDPANYLSPSEQTEVMQKIIRYVAKPPRRVLGDEKFDTLYDDHYNLQIRLHELLAYYIDNNGEHYFLVARQAPSTDVKWIATGGKMRFGKGGELTEYEEVFRTWKLKRPDMESRAKYLFDLMVKGEDLSPYYTDKAGFNYIEFPDEHVYFDKQARRWKSDLYTSVEEMVYESRDVDSLRKKYPAPR
jgi:hypothetical protein